MSSRKQRNCKPPKRTFSASGMKVLHLPSKPHKQVVATNSSELGREAATSLTQTATGRGWDVSMMVGPDKRDWNDTLQDGLTA